MQDSAMGSHGSTGAVPAPTRRQSRSGPLEHLHGAPAPRLQRRSRGERWLIGLELFMGLSAVTGGLLLIARPDGSLLQAKLSVLRGTPFSDWRIPGVFLASCIGGGSLLTAAWLWRRVRSARALSILDALGTMAFELVEWVLIGFQPLEALVSALAAGMLILARRLPAFRAGA